MTEDELVRQHTPLVVSIAFTYKPKPPNDYDDLISVGMIGLLKAIRAYDPSRGIQFSTLAYRVINREIIRELDRSPNKHDYQPLDFDVSGDKIDNIEDYLPDNLTDLEKEILLLRFHLGHTFEEIGEKFNKTKQWANIVYAGAIYKIAESNEKKKNIVAE